MDGYNCGIIILLIMIQIAEERNLVEMKPDSFRIQILDFLFCHSLSNICLSPACGKPELLITEDKNMAHLRNKIRKCNICGRWVHELCCPEIFFVAETCLLCIDPQIMNMNVSKEVLTSKKKFYQSKNINCNSFKSPDQKSYVGLLNFDKMTCWLNSALQIFFGLPIFAALKDLLSSDQRSSLVNSFIKIIDNLTSE